MFAQLDYIRTKSRWHPHFATVGTVPQLDYDSDHLPLEATLHLHWKFGSPQPPPKPDRHTRKCNADTARQYNAQLEQAPFAWDTIQETIKDTAIQTRGLQPKSVKKPYLTQPTLDLLRARDEALAGNRQQKAKLLTTQFRRQVQRDKKQHQTEQLQTFEGSRQNWPAIKQLRTAFVPKFSKRGTTKASIPANFPNDCAQYFATKHWENIPRMACPEKPPLHPKTPEEGHFTKPELDAAIGGLRKNKAGGPDNLITELFQDMNDINRTKLLELYNQIYDSESIPAHFNEAHVVQIYKQGKPPEAYSSYRPIALLNITYKILAKMLQERLRTALDARLVPFQYGYRRGKSTAEPIFIARRTKDLAERTGNPLYMLALDYSKAFDSIPHYKLTESLRRKGASDKNIALVNAIYRHPTFRIKITEGISNEHPQKIGIRQGCPPSPLTSISSQHPAS